MPELEAKGAATWGARREEALKNIEEVLHMVLGDLLDEGAALPAGVTVVDESVAAVTL